MSIYLKFGEVKGDVQESGHPNWIEITSANWSVQRNGVSYHGGKPIDAPSFSSLHLTKVQDVASLSLIMRACEGTPADVQIDFCRTGTDKMVVYWGIVLGGAIITSFGQAGSVSHTDGSTRPMENLTLDFDQISFVGMQMDSDGSSTSLASFGWDIKTRASL